MFQFWCELRMWVFAKTVTYANVEMFGLKLKASGFLFTIQIIIVRTSMYHVVFEPNQYWYCIWL